MMIHLLPTIRQDFCECHAQKSQNNARNMAGNEGMCSSCFLKTKCTCLTFGNYFCMRCSVFAKEEDTPGWKEGKTVAYCESCFNEMMKRRESSQGQDDAVGKEDSSNKPYSSTDSTETKSESYLLSQ